jgi:replicative DNA helicase
MNAPIEPDYLSDPACAMVPPHSIEAEQSVLGGLLIDNTAWDRISHQITVSDFYRYENRVIFAAISSLIAACKPADVITVFEQLQRIGKDDGCGGLKYLNDLAQTVPSASNARRYAEIIAEKAAQRAIAEAVRKAGDLAEGDGTVAEKLDRIGAVFGQLERTQITTAPRAIADIAIRRTEHYESLERGDVAPGWPTRIGALDRLLNGGLAPGRLYIVAARPSVGKSSFSQAIGLNLTAAGLPSLFLSQEMTCDEVADRAVSNLGRIEYSALLSGKMCQDDWSRAGEALEAMGRLPFFVDDKPALRLVEIRSKARAIKGLKVLVLDYLQLCSSDLSRESRNGQIEELSRGLKTLAKELGIAIIALSQLNRAVETRNTKRPMLADLRDSGAIEQDADCVVFLWPVRELDDGRKLIGCAIEKNRSGPCGAFGLDFSGDVQRWGESTLSIEPPAQSRGAKGGFE